MSGELDAASYERRMRIIGILEKSRRGHVGSAFSLVEILRVLFETVLRVDPKNPSWPGRDRFILSKGHGCLALYVEMARKGFFPDEELDRFCAPEAMLGGHPEYGLIPGVEASTGSLGHGLSIGVGMALAAKLDREDWRVYVVVSDGECDEGTVWEAALCAAKHKLDNLTVILDYNKMQCYSSTEEVLDLEPLEAKWRSFGFEVASADGHYVEDLKAKLSRAPLAEGKPGIVICRTVKGRGIPYLENNPQWHHKSRIGDDEIKELRDACEKAAKGGRA